MKDIEVTIFVDNILNVMHEIRLYIRMNARNSNEGYDFINRTTLLSIYLPLIVSILFMENTYAFCLVIELIYREIKRDNEFDKIVIWN